MWLLFLVSMLLQLLGGFAKIQLFSAQSKTKMEPHLGRWCTLGWGVAMLLWRVVIVVTVERRGRGSMVPACCLHGSWWWAAIATRGAAVAAWRPLLLLLLLWDSERVRVLQLTTRRGTCDAVREIGGQNTEMHPVCGQLSPGSVPSRDLSVHFITS